MQEVFLTFPLSLGHFQSFWVHLEISEQNKSYCLNKTHNSRYIESVLESHDFRGLSATNFILVLKKCPQLLNWEKLFLMFVCYAYELCIPKEFSVENEIMRNQGFADICCFKPELLGQSLLIILRSSYPSGIS